MMRKQTFWIVIVNYRTADLTIDCLRSLAQQVAVMAGCQVVVIDNDSGDESADRISTAITTMAWHDWARLTVLPRNGGFAYGNNAGIRMALEAGAEYVMLLNPDTVVRAGALVSLLDFIADHPQVGIEGSLLEDLEGGVDCSAHRVHSPLGELVESARLGLLSRLLDKYCISPQLSDEAQQCDWVSGAAMVIRRQVLEQVGLMDEGFFLYFEEVDLCWRAKRMGWEVWYVPQSRVMHLEGASTGIREARRRPSYWYDSRRRFFIKHYGFGGLLLADLLWLLGRSSYLLRRALHLGGRQQSSDPKSFMADLLWGDMKFLVSVATKIKTS